MTKKNFNPSKATYDALHAAYDHFNAELFGGRLPPAMLTIHRKRNAHGYFWAKQFRERNDKKLELDEIALNPETMGRDPKTVLSTLVHEMCHLEQEHFGKPAKGGYHNKEWAGMMKAVGLMPSVTGQPGAPETGRRVTHYIEIGGVFDKTCDAFLGKGHDLSWFAMQPVKSERKRDLSKVKHTCPDCETNIWGKLGIEVYCGECNVMFEPEEK